MKKILSLVAVNLLITLVLLLTIELALRLVWHNPYLDAPLDTSARLHAKNLDIEVSSEGYYPLSESIRFHTREDRSISNGVVQVGSTFIALGGSTTESSLVPEGDRWPDLLAPAALNFGVSGNYLIDSYYNLIHLHEALAPPPDTATIMHAVNDLGFFVNRGAENFEINNWSHRLEHPLVTFDNTNRVVFGGVKISSSSVMSLITYLRNNSGVRLIIEPSVALKEARDNMSILEDVEFQKLKSEFVNEFLPKRLSVYEQISRTSSRLRVKLILLSQPHAFVKDYTPPIQDLRVTPVWSGRRLTITQTSELMDLLNEQTLNFAQENSIKSIDLAKCIGSQEVGPLLYDSVHYSMQGSKAVAECINSEM